MPRSRGPGLQTRSSVGRDLAALLIFWHTSTLFAAAVEEIGSTIAYNMSRASDQVQACTSRMTSFPSSIPPFSLNINPQRGTIL